MANTNTIFRSLSRLSSSRRLSVTCSGSDLGQLYLSSPEQDAVDILSSSQSLSRTRDNRGSGRSLNDSWGNVTIESDSDSLENDRQLSWLEAVDLYGKKTSFSHRRNSYVKFLDIEVIDEEENEFLIEETDNGIVQKTGYWSHPSLVVPLLMLLDLALGISLSLYDSNLLRNVPDFHFPLCYAWTQKATNAIASLILIGLSRKWEMAERKRLQLKSTELDDSGDNKLTEMPSIQVFKRNIIPLSAIALVQTLSAAFANCSLQLLPLPLFKVVLMCGPIFVAFITSAIEGNVYSKGRILALSLIGIGALRAVYAEAEGADNPRVVMEGAAYALGASALSGMGLVVSGVLMHKDDAMENNENNPREKQVEEELNPLSLLFYLSCEQVVMLTLYLCPWQMFWISSSLKDDAGDEEFLAFMLYFQANPEQALFYLMTGSTIALCLAVLTFTLVTRTSPVAASLLGNVRSIATVAISSFVWGGASRTEAPVSLFGSAIFGYVLTLLGGVVYALVPANNGAAIK